MEKLNVAVIGTGMMGKNHARIYSILDNVNLVAICDLDKKAAKEIADAYNTNHYDDYKEMLKKESIDAVSICVPTKMHRQIAVDFIKNKIHVLVEKPIATTVEEAEQVIEEAKKNNIKLMVGHIERFNPVVVEIKKRLNNNELGNVLMVNCERMSLFPLRIIDVGITIDLAIHDIDTLRYLIGSKIKRVYAETVQRLHSTCEDLMIGSIRFDNSTLGVISANWFTPKKVRTIRITGEKGMFVADYLAPELYFYPKSSKGTIADFAESSKNKTELRKVMITLENKEPLKEELMHFIDCIKEDKEPLVTGRDGLEALDIALKFLESAKYQKVIGL